MLLANFQLLLASAAQADRWQCARGVDATSLADLLALLAEALHRPGWSAAVMAPLHTASAGGHPELTLAQFCHVVCEARLEMSTAAAAAKAAADEAAIADAAADPAAAVAAGVAAATDGLLAPLLSLQGPGTRTTGLSDESFADPLRHLKVGEAPTSVLGNGHVTFGNSVTRASSGCIAWLETCGMDVDAGLAKAQVGLQTRTAASLPSSPP